MEHQWGCSSQPVHGGPASGAPVSVFRHRLLQLFQLSIFCKLPVLPISTLDGLRRGFMVRILLSVLQFRVNGRYVEANPPFTGIGESVAAGTHATAVWCELRWVGKGDVGCRATCGIGRWCPPRPHCRTAYAAFVGLAPDLASCSPPASCLPACLPAELDISDSGREGCAVSTLTITSEPKDWRGAVEVRLVRLGERAACLWGRRWGQRSQSHCFGSVAELCTGSTLLTPSWRGRGACN